MSEEIKIYADDKGIYGSFINFFVKMARYIPLPAKIKQLIRYEIASYVFIGGMTTLVYLVCWYTINLFKDKAPINPDLYMQIDNMVSWVVGVLFAFYPNKYLCFESYTKERKVVFKEFSAFTLSRISTLLVDMGFMYLTVTMLHFNDNIMKLIAQIAVVIGNYIISKFFVFNSKK
ncbi:membrane protein [Clostridia bacterium]|nr:membrane protein [Clostridia bacterium]